MNKFLILLLITNFINAQSRTVVASKSLVENNEFKTAIIHLNDGTSVDGIGKLKTILTTREEVIVFKKDENDNDKTWTSKDVKGITIIDDDEVRDYQYLKVSKYSFPELYEVVVDGFVILYEKIKISVIRETLDDSNLKSPSVRSYEKKTYYLKKEQEEFPTKIKDNYIKSTSEYMKDCDPLVRKIKNHEYDYSMIKELVEYYNDICGE